MSIIHQALKKIEGGRHVHGADGKAVLCGTVGRGDGLRKHALLIVLSLIIVAAIAWRIHLQYGSDGIRPSQVIERGGVTAAGSIRAINSDAAGGREVMDPSVRNEPAPEAAGRNFLGVELYRSGLYEDAAVEFSAAVGLASESAVYHNNLAIAYLGLDDRASAETHLKEALRIVPEYPEAINNYGTLLASTGRHKEAFELFSKAVKLAPSLTDARLNLAVSLERKGEYRNAVQEYEEYMRLVSADSAGGIAGTMEEEMSAEVRKKVRRLRTLPLTIKRQQLRRSNAGRGR